GVQIASWMLCTSFPQSLDFAGGGNEVRLGLYSAHNPTTVYEAWPAWEIKDVWLNFHAEAESSLSTSFASFQAPLVGRAPLKQYKDANVFLWRIPDPADEDAFYLATAASSNPVLPVKMFCKPGAAPCFADADAHAKPNPTIGNTLQFFNWGGGGGPRLQEEL